MPESYDLGFFVDDMKRLLQITIATILLGSLTIQAAPLKTWSWIDPVAYENGQNIPGGDLTNRTILCGIQSGGPYFASKTFEMQAPPSIEDMAFVVFGVSGTYYCVTTVDSILYQTTSKYSNEVSFVVAKKKSGCSAF